MFIIANIYTPFLRYIIYNIIPASEEYSIALANIYFSMVYVYKRP